VSLAAAEEQVEVSLEGDSLSIEVRASAVDGLLPQFVQDRLRRGLPATVGVQAELWHDRSGWFDAHRRTTIREFRLSRDAWTETYQLLDGNRPDDSFSADSLSTIVAEIENRSVSLTIESSWGRSTAVHWVEATVVIVPLAVSDLGEVDDWLSGEIESGPLLGIPRGLFRIVRDLTGLGDRKILGRSKPFRMSLIANDLVWIQPL